MMASINSTITVPPPTLALKVKMPPLYSLRLKAAAWIIGLAGHVAGSVIDITIEADALRPSDSNR